MGVKQDAACAYTKEEDLPVTSCCEKMVHEKCLVGLIAYFHCPHWREVMPLVTGLVNM